MTNTTMRKTVFVSLLLGWLMLTLTACGTTSGLYNKPASWDQASMGCNGDVPSPYPPYCHPRR